MTFSAHQKPTVGDTKFSAATSDHLGWIRCDGRTFNVADFQFLFNVIGYSFGGSGTQFTLPDPRGRVPGAIGLGKDINNSTFTAILGLSTGEYVHTLTIPEIPSHNHGVAAGVQNAANNSTSVVNVTVNDPGHRHGYTSWLDSNRGYVAAGENDNVLGGTSNRTSDSNVTGITLTNGVHAHTLNAAGGDLAHNNVQPTLFMGNMFIYCGIVNYPSFTTGYPYTIGKNLW